MTDVEAEMNELNEHARILSTEVDQKEMELAQLKEELVSAESAQKSRMAEDVKNQ